MKITANDEYSRYVKVIRVDGVVYENVIQLNTTEGWADYILKKEHWADAGVLRVEGKVEIEWEEGYAGPE